MKKILVHLHFYYQDMWPEFREYIKNLSDYSYDLFVTLGAHNTDLEQDITSFAPNARIILCENRGFDIRPFVQIMQSIDLQDYSYIVKLHTKRDIEGISYLNNFYFTGNEWREALCSIVKSQQNFRRIIDSLESNPLMGMCGSHFLIVNMAKDKDKPACQKYRELLQNNDLPLVSHTFMAGTMFVARAKIFDLLRYIDLDAFDTAIQHGGQYVHGVERFFGYCVAYHGLGIHDPLVNNWDVLKKSLRRGVLLWKVRRFFFSYERNKKGVMRLKILKIPLPLSLFIKEK